MTVETYLAYLVVVAVFFATPPGPSQILMVAHSVRHGAFRALWTAAGDLTANALQMTAAAFGLAALVAASDTALDAVKWAGVAYLVYMGVRTFRAPPRAPADAARHATPGRLWLQGFVTSASNPKAVVFFAALFPQFVDASAPILPQLAALGATYLVVDGAILYLYGLIAQRTLGSLVRAPLRLNRISGMLMIGAAGVLGARDLQAR